MARTSESTRERIAVPATRRQQIGILLLLAGGIVLVVAIANAAYTKSQMPCVPCPPGQTMSMEEREEASNSLPGDWRVGLLIAMLYGAGVFCVIVPGNGSRR